MIENQQVVGEVTEYAKDGYPLTDAEFYDWCFKHISSGDAFLRVIENASEIVIGSAFMMLCQNKHTEGLMTQADCRDVVCASTLRGQIMPILKKYYWNDCVEFFDNGGSL